jgi:signal transduction histidine kinase
MFYARKALQIAQDAPFLKQVMEISTFLSGVFKEIGGTDSAFKYLELSIATKDSLFNAENSRKVQGLKFQELQRQQAIETARIKFQNRIKLYGVIFLSLIFLVAALLQWRNNRQKQKAYALLQSQKEKTDQALKVLKETQNQLIQQEKMASLGELTAGIAHEIQNPLNFVNNFTELNRELIAELKLEIDRGNYPEARSIADDIDINEEKIVTHGKRADAIVKSMLQHSRTGNWQKELTNVNALCDEYFRLAYHGMRSRDNSFNVELKSDFDPSVGWRNIVPQDIGRVLLNLLNNAFYAVRQKAKSAGEPYKPEVQVCTRMTANLANAGPSEGTETLVIEVRDNGTGMPAKAMEKIFQPFFTTKPTGEGTGLGLSLCYDIVKAHGGEIKVESREREGTLFIVALPV